MKTFRSASSAGIVKCFRYQVLPVHIDFSPSASDFVRCEYVSTSLNVWGVLTFAQAVSSKAGACAPTTSCRMNFQPTLKLNLVRGLGSSAGPPSGSGAPPAPPEPTLASPGAPPAPVSPPPPEVEPVVIEPVVAS